MPYLSIRIQGLLACFALLGALLFPRPLLAERTVVSFYAETALFQNAEGPYVEIFLAVDGSNLAYREVEPGKWRARAHVKLECGPRAAAPDRPAYRQDFFLNSPDLPDTAKATRRIYLMQGFRVSVPADSMRLTVEARDDYADSSSTTKIIRDFDVPPVNKDALQFSDVVWLESIGDAIPDDPFTKHGVRLLPYVADDVFLDRDSLNFYVEYYRLDKIAPGQHAMRVYVTEANSGRRVPGFDMRTRPRPTESTNILQLSFGMRKLPSQTYVLHVEALGADGATLGQTQRRFFVYNSLEDSRQPDDDRYLALYDQLYGYKHKELDEYLATLEYLSSEEERRMRHALVEYDDKRKYFYHFWLKRQKDPAAPAKEWFNYKNRIDYANRTYRSSFRPGWRTDRGRVLLTHGPADDVQAFPTDTDKLPYEIWSYNRLGNQAGVIFVFIDRDLASNEYRLHHSTLQGEMYNSNWRRNVLRQPDHNYSLDGTDQMYDQFKDTTPGATGRPR